MPNSSIPLYLLKMVDSTSEHQHVFVMNDLKSHEAQRLVDLTELLA